MGRGVLISGKWLGGCPQGFQGSGCALEHETGGGQGVGQAVCVIWCLGILPLDQRMPRRQEWRPVVRRESQGMTQRT